MLDLFLSTADSARASRTVQSLAMHEISAWALTGGAAIELHILGLGGKPLVRPLHDIDFITESFAAIPTTLGDRLLLSHLHPHDPPGKSLFQAVEPETRVRIDVFRAYGSEMERTVLFPIAGHALKVVSLEDIVARLARLSWDLIEGKPLAPKYPRDFLRLLDHVTADEVEPVWQEHRKPHCGETFPEVVERLRKAIRSRRDLLIEPTYSCNVHEVCPRCHETEDFPRIDRSRILSILGYC